MVQCGACLFASLCIISFSSVIRVFPSVTSRGDPLRQWPVPLIAASLSGSMSHTRTFLSFVLSTVFIKLKATKVNCKEYCTVHSVYSYVQNHNCVTTVLFSIHSFPITSSPSLLPFSSSPFLSPHPFLSQLLTAACLFNREVCTLRDLSTFKVTYIMLEVSEL